MRHSANSPIKRMLSIAAAIVVLGLTVVIWNQHGSDQPQTNESKADLYTALNLKDPSPSYLLLQYVADKGGDQYTRQFAIDWLSEQARMRSRLKPDQEDWLFSMIESGGHPDWEIGYKQWLFNDSFNVLRMAGDQERLTVLLKDLALTHEDKTMRLYALQHIEIQRSAGNLVDALAEDMRATLIELAYTKQSEVAGTALVNLVAWDGPESEPSAELIDLALKLAADRERTDDIRVTALHAIKEHSLELSRQIAPDTTQPVHVRKAAIAWMGKYGSEADTETLKRLSQENFRIAQAANPALEAINNRKSGKPERTLIQL